MYGCVFVVGYLLSMTVSAWERQRFVEAEVAGNGIVARLRLGLYDELDRLQRDLEAAGPPLEAARAKSKQADEAFGDVRARSSARHQRAANIKERYAITPADEQEILYRMLRAPGPGPGRGPSKSPDSRVEKDDKDKTAPATRAPPAGRARNPRGRDRIDSRRSNSRPGRDGPIGSLNRSLSTAISPEGPAVPATAPAQPETRLMPPPSPHEPLQLSAEDLYSPRVDAFLDEQAMMNRAMPEVQPQPWILRVLYSSYFYLSLASGLGAMLAWMMIEPFISESRPRRR